MHGSEVVQIVRVVSENIEALHVIHFEQASKSIFGTSAAPLLQLIRVFVDNGFQLLHTATFQVYLPKYIKRRAFSK